MKNKLFYIIVFLGIILDLFSKQLAARFLDTKINIIGDILFLKYVENTGIAFSVQLPFIKIFTIILILGIFYYYYTQERTKKDMLVDSAFGLILAGAIGNGIERIFNGFVIDFLGVQAFSVFNLADAFITIGAGLYIYHIFILENKKNN